MSKPKGVKHYWNCRFCTLALGADPNSDLTGQTCVGGICQNCDGKKQKKGEFLHPWVDYDWPSDKSADSAAKMGRD